MRAGEQYPAGLGELDKLEESHPTRARELTARLLMSLPARAPLAQMPVLDRLLDRLLKAGEPELNQLVKEKLSMRSLGIAQRIRWLTVGALVSPERYLAEFEEYAGKNQQRTEHLARFLCNRFHNHWFVNSPLLVNLSPRTIAAFIRLLGGLYDPVDISGMGGVSVDLELDTSRRTENLITLLGSKASEQANSALRDLAEDSQLVRWKDRLTMVEEQQRVLLRNAPPDRKS